MPSPEEKGHSTGIAGILVPALARGLIRFITWSVRLHCEGISTFDELKSEGRMAIFSFFHGRQLLLAGRFRNNKISVMASLSRDGELQTRIMTGLGFEVVRGSASRSGARGLIGLKKLLDKGYYATFAVDGPRGPIHEVKPGAVYLAKKSKVPVVPVATSANPSYILYRAWDHFLLPKPFSKGAIIIGEPIYFSDDMGQEAVSRDCLVLQEELLRLQDKADRITGLKSVNSER